MLLNFVTMLVVIPFIILLLSPYYFVVIPFIILLLSPLLFRCYPFFSLLSPYYFVVIPLIIVLFVCLFFCRSTDSQLKLWDVKRGQCIKSFKGHSNEKNFVGLATNGDYIACGASQFVVTRSKDSSPK